MIWVFPKIGVKPPKSSILIGFSIIFTIHFGVPLFLETPIRTVLIIPTWFLAGIFGAIHSLKLEGSP